MKNFSIIITTYNRLENLKITLESLSNIFHDNVELLICDDNSLDGTFEWLKVNYPNAKVFKNIINKGYIYSRNLLMNEVQTDFAISIDDDANFLCVNPLEKIRAHFKENDNCGVIGFRIFWGIKEPSFTISDEVHCIVKSFVGCGQAWNMEAWKDIPDYPTWYKFYGEENFASLQLYKKKWEIHYLPSVLVHHRVNNKERIINNDYYLRQKLAIRADWFNYLLFYPKAFIPKRLIYSIYMQLKKAVKYKSWKIFKLTLEALFSLFENYKVIKASRNSLTKEQLQKWLNLAETKIYWKPKN